MKLKTAFASLILRLLNLAVGTALIGAVVLAVICGLSALAAAFPWPCIAVGLVGFSLAMLSELKPEPKPVKKPAGKVGGITKARKSA